MNREKWNSASHQWKTKETRNLLGGKQKDETKRKTQKVNVKKEEDATRSRGDEENGNQKTDCVHKLH